MEKLVQAHQLRSVLDVACGTGLHAIILARMGVRVVGTDISQAMLEKAKKNGQASGHDIQWIEAPMQALSTTIKGSFDAVICLGNSIPHILSGQDLETTLKGFHKLLRPEGILLFQLLNYDRILAKRERIVGIHRDGSHEYIRFYDFGKKTVKFNILTITDINHKMTHGISSTELYPYKKNELADALKKTGFTECKYFGNLDQDPFNAEMSQNLVILCRKVK
jgi:2-polyprenyl-3-methyl-5-hydroxy-6-metoxy-1,4-benzoquinol methylase